MTRLPEPRLRGAAQTFGQHLRHHFQGADGEGFGESASSAASYILAKSVQRAVVDTLTETLPRVIVRAISGRVMTTVEVPRSEAAYLWVRRWLAERPEAGRARHVKLGVNRAGLIYFQDEDEDEESKPLVFVPAREDTFFRFEGHPVWVAHRHEDNKDRGRSDERYVLRTLGSRGILEALLLEARRVSETAGGPRMLEVHVPSSDGWTVADRQLPRSLDSLILEGDAGQRVVDDVRLFRSRQDWYARMGIPWRRSYLVDGPTGSGKTSLVKVVAAELRANICAINLSSSGLSDDKLSHLLAQARPKDVLLLEEVDTVFEGRRTVSSGPLDGALTFNGLLQALDGVASKDGLVTFMTTNHKGRLDPALIRPGRADVHLTLGDATPGQVRRLFRRFYPLASPSLEALMGRAVEPDSVSMAVLQEHFMRFLNDPDGAVKAAGGLVPVGARKVGA